VPQSLPWFAPQSQGLNCCPRYTAGGRSLSDAADRSQGREHSASMRPRCSARNVRAPQRQPKSFRRLPLPARAVSGRPGACRLFAPESGSEGSLAGDGPSNLGETVTQSLPVYEQDLLERESELGAVEELIGAGGRAGRLLVIEGAPGIGKTALVAAAKGLGQAAGLRVLGARGWELERSFSYGIVRQLFEPLLACERADERAGLLAGLGRWQRRCLIPPRSRLIRRETRRWRRCTGCIGWRRTSQSGSPWLGAALRRAGQRVQAREHLRRAVELATICGAAALAARAETELRATGARPRRIALSGVESLTPSERASPSWPPEARPTERSRKPCSSPSGRSRSTSPASSGSSTSARARNWPPRSTAAPAADLHVAP
jgi:hypothetical protein